jgi:hypothetical protein
MIRRARSRGAPAALALALLHAAPGWLDAPARAQTPVLDVVEDVAFERPEAWAMRYFGSIATLAPLGAARSREPWSIDAALEVAQIPQLGAAERTVGFNGLKEEDLNRLPVMVRPRLVLGLPARLALEVGYVPPLRVDGVEPNLVSLALERSLYERERFTLGARVFGQAGGVEGDLTCSERDAAFPPGSPGNEFGCEAASRDESSLEHLGFHLGAGWDLRRAGGSTLLFGASVVRHDLEFQVDAFTFGLHDRTLLRTEGTTYALDAGIAIPAAARAEVAIALHWSPLDVVRPPRTSAENDDLLHQRALLRYRVR